MVNKKWSTKRLTINLAKTEEDILDEFSNKTGRPITDIVRELIRSLASNASTAIAPTNSTEVKN